MAHKYVCTFCTFISPGSTGTGVHHYNVEVLLYNEQRLTACPVFMRFFNSDFRETSSLTLISVCAVLSIILDTIKFVDPEVDGHQTAI